MPVADLDVVVVGAGVAGIYAVRERSDSQLSDSMATVSSWR